MSIRVSTLIWRKRLPAPRPLAKAVLLALANYADDDGRNAWPAVATMAARTEMSERAVHKSLKELQAINLIAEQEPPRQHRPRVWLLNLDVIGQLQEARVAPHASLEDGSPARDASLEDSRVASGAGLSASDGHVREPGMHVRQSRHARGAPDPSVIRPDPEERTTPAQKPGAEKGDAASEVLRLFSDGYQRKVGEQYAFDKRARERAEQLLTVQPLDRIGRTIVAFFASADPWYADNGFPFAAFVKQFEMIAASGRTADEDRSHDPVATTDDYLRRLRSVSSPSPMPEYMRLAIRGGRR